MQSNSSFITIFVLLFLQIFTESIAASTSRNSGVRWETSELEPVKSTAEQDSNTSFKNMFKKLFLILDEMQNIIDLMPADDANVNGDSGHQQDPFGSASAANSEFSEHLRQRKQNALNSYLAIVWNVTNSAHPNQPMPSSQGPLKDNPTTQQLDNLIRNIDDRQRLTEFSFRPRMMSLYPSCNNSSMDDNKVPNNSIDLVFDLSFSKPSHDVIVNVTSAILRIYKKSVFKDSYSIPFQPNKSVTFNAMYYKSPHHNTRKDPNKRGMKLGEQTFRVDEERWTEWDIKKAVSTWYNNTSRNNGVVTIKVADDQIRLPAREFFNIPINCSYITEWPALPPEVIRNSSYAGISSEIPFLDMTIMEVPKAEVKFVEKEQELVREVNSIKKQVNAVYNTANSTTEHKFRHHKKNNKETIEGNV